MNGTPLNLMEWHSTFLREYRKLACAAENVDHDYLRLSDRIPEASFGADFTGVRVHTNGDSDALSRSLGASAFTSSQDI